MRLLRPAIEADGWEVFSALNCDVALVVIASVVVGVIVTDLRLGHGGDGMYLADRVRGKVPIILASGVSPDSSWAFFDAVVPKPVDVASLLLLMNQLHETWDTLSLRH